MPDIKSSVLLSDSQLKNLSNIQNSLFKGIAETAKGFDLTRASWDQVSWGRQSSIRRDTGELESFSDRLEVAIDPRTK